MPTIPDRFAPAIRWCGQRLDQWQENRALLGLTQAGVDELDQQTQSARDARARFLKAQRELRDAALVYRTEVGTMRATAAALLATIRATAKRSDEPGAVYSAASVPPPAGRGPSPTPGTPGRFTTRLLFGGSLRVEFECPHPAGVRGVTYRVERLVLNGTAPGGRPEFLLNAKKRGFTDDTIPPGTARVEYRVTAQTSTRDGDMAGHTVWFGQDSMARETAEAPQKDKAA